MKRTSTLHFHYSLPVYSLPFHKLYKSIDWTKVEAGFHAVVDPMEPNSILYLSEQDYIRQLRVSLSTDHTLKVLAKAGTAKVSPASSPSASKDPTGSSETPPTRINTHPFLDEFYTGSRTSRLAAIKRVQYSFHGAYTDFLESRGKSSGTVKALMIEVTYRNIGDLLLRWFNQLTYWKTGSKGSKLHRGAFLAFTLYLAKLVRTQGINAVIQRMKVGLFVLNSFLGGKKLPSTQPLGLRITLRHGLPAFLPLFARQALRARSVRHIHIWVSVLNSYKVMMAKWLPPSLETVTAPHPDLSGVSHFKGFKDFVPLFLEAAKINPVRSPSDLSVEKGTRYDILFTAKSGPNGGPALLGIGADAYAWRLQPKNLILEWLELTGASMVKQWFLDSASVWSSNCYSFRNCPENALTLPLRKGAIREGTRFLSGEFPDIALGYGKPLTYRRPILRRLHALYEAAGKVRIIAIVDYWTQLCLKPLHSWMFDILRTLPQDATFDQEGKLSDFMKRGYDKFYCYDLKSATDLIPLQLYEELFKALLPKRILSLWLELLVGLPF